MNLAEVNLEGLPKDFVWGAATSSYQVEGGAASGSRGRCIWDDFALVPGAVFDGTTHPRGIEHIRHLEADLDLMMGLGLDSYRFSISWPRVQPGGRGAFSTVGLDFYERLVDGLLARGITPNATLYHWDLPAELQAEGGWANAGTVDAFAEYAAGVSQTLGDRVKQWATLNEPWCTAYLGHLNGHHAPGLKDLPTTVRVAHQLVRAHALASTAVRSSVHDARIGVVLNLADQVFIGEESAEIAQERSIIDGMQNRWWLEGMLRGSYPQDVVAHFERLTGIHIDESEIPDISQGRDWLGLNYYNANVLAPGEGGIDVFPGVSRVVGAAYGEERTDMGWPWTPAGVGALLLKLGEQFPGLPLYVTENGAAYSTAPSADGRVHDTKREQYLAEYIASALAACRAGADLRGYYVWSLFDNFEWAFGNAQRFGIVWVDYDTWERVPKDSAFAYKQLIERFKTL
jgi:beta-glucosidase